MYSSTPFRNRVLSDGSSCGDIQELANKLGKSSRVELGVSGSSARPGDVESAESKGSIRLAWICWYVTFFGVFLASVKKGARTSFMGTGFRAVIIVEALSSSVSQISLR